MQLIRSYLENRTYAVHMQSGKSQVHSAGGIGVPQGAVLAPLL